MNIIKTETLSELKSRRLKLSLKVSKKEKELNKIEESIRKLQKKAGLIKEKIHPIKHYEISGLNYAITKMETLNAVYRQIYTLKGNYTKYMRFVDNNKKEIKEV